MKIKEKKCKGQNKAINFDGCGGLVLVRTYGLCSTCYDSWLKTTPEGKEQLYKHAIKHVTNIRKIKTEQKTKNKELLKTRSDWQKDVQVKINKIIRLRI
jgi:Fe-S cluster biogenesis protein NfuA